MSEWLPYPWQLDVWSHLDQLYKDARLPHALLMNGEKGSGKGALVQGLVKKLLCHETTEFACGQCKSCQLYDSGTHPDFVQIGLLEKSKLIKIDQVRSTIDFISKTSQMGGMKIVVIEPAEQMNINAANALLKCLEEPSGDSLIILIAHAPNRLLPTIRSRCQNIVMQKPGQQQADQWLSTFISDIKQREQLLMLANGNPLLAVEYFDKEVIKLYTDSIDKLVALKTGNGSLVKYAEELQKEDVGIWLDINQKLIWQMIQKSLNISDSSSTVVNVFDPVIRSNGFVKRAYRMLEEIQQAIKEVQGQSNPNPQMIIESLLIRWQALLRV